VAGYESADPQLSDAATSIEIGLLVGKTQYTISINGCKMSKIFCSSDSLYERCIGPSIAFQTKIPLNELKDMVSFTSSMVFYAVERFTTF
jgi:hypothetical protein